MRPKRRVFVRSFAAVVLIALVATACQSTTEISDPGALPATATADDTPPPTTASQPGPTAAVVEPTAEARPAPTAAAADPEPTTNPVRRPSRLRDPLGDAFAMSALRTVECPPEASGAQITCSIASVPLNAFAPVEGEMVELMVAYVDNGDQFGTGPVVFLQGGPGVGSVGNAPRFVGNPHDIIFFDQRGTGHSTPNLNCPEVDELWEARIADEPAVRVENDSIYLNAYEDCADRLRGEGINLDHFNTRASAADVELLRRLYGEQQWALWGISYGTRLGLAIMRDHPEGVRAAVLDSVVPFEIDFFATIPQYGLRSIEALDAQCDSDQCAADHGDFYENLSSLVRRLDEEPIVVVAERPALGSSFAVRVDGTALLAMVFVQMYSTRALESLPRQIARAEFGGIEEIVTSFIALRDPLGIDWAAGMYYTTWCREEFPFHDPSLDDDLLNDLVDDFGNSFRRALSSGDVAPICRSFDVARSPLRDNQPIRSDIPTLVFAGQFDPITPPEWSQSVAEQIDDARFVLMPDHGHGMTGSCTVSLRNDFLADPTTDLDLTCVNQTGGPDFE